MHSNNANDNASRVKKTDTLVDIMRTVISYARVFPSTYNMSYESASVTAIVKDICNSNFISKAPETVRKYIRFSKCLLRNNAVYKFFFERSTNNQQEQFRQQQLFNIRHFDSNILYKATPYEASVMLTCLQEYWNGESSPTSTNFNCTKFYSTVKLFVGEMHEYYEAVSKRPQREEEAVTPASFPEFMQCQIWNTRSTKTTPYALIINNMKAFSYNKDDPKRYESTVKGQLTRLKSKCNTRYYPEQSKQSDKPSSASLSKPRARRRGAASRAAANLLDGLDDDVQFVTGPKRRRTTTMNQGGRSTRSTRSRPGSANNATTNTPLVQDGSEDDGEPKLFDDSFDVARVPQGYHIQHYRATKMVDCKPTLDLFQVARKIYVTEEFDQLMGDGTPENDQESFHAKWQATHLIPRDQYLGENEHQLIDPSSYFKCAFVPATHRAHVFCDFDSYFHMVDMSITWGVFSEKYNNDDPNLNNIDNLDIEQKWTRIFASRDNGDGHMNDRARTFYRGKRNQLESDGYTILVGMADVHGFPSVENSGEAPASMRTLSIGEFYDKIHRTFPGETYLQEEENRDLWNPIVNRDDSIKDKNDRDMGQARYSSTV